MVSFTNNNNPEIVPISEQYKKFKELPPDEQLKQWRIAELWFLNPLVFPRPSEGFMRVVRELIDWEGCLSRPSLILETKTAIEWLEHLIEAATTDSETDFDSTLELFIEMLDRAGWLRFSDIKEFVYGEFSIRVLIGAGICEVDNMVSGDKLIPIGYKITPRGRGFYHLLIYHPRAVTRKIGVSIDLGWKGKIKRPRSFWRAS